MTMSDRGRLVRTSSLILTSSDARMLYYAAKLGDLRTRNRVGNSALYELLTDISRVVFTDDAGTGIDERQSLASQQDRGWDVDQIVKKTGLASRTIRLAAQTGELKGEKVHGSWFFSPEAAATYIESRRKS